MSIVSTTIPNLINGVSQQPYALRLASQAEEQVNGYSSVVEGLRKRPPSRHAAKFSSTPLPAAHVHMINRDANERYIVVTTNGDLKVFRLDGTQVTVNFPSGKGYLSTVNPHEDITAVTVADYTFLVNKQVTCQALPTTVAARPFEAMFWVKQGAYSTTYQATVAGTSAVFTTPHATGADQAALITTTHIASQLCNQLAGLSSYGYNVGLFGSVIYVSHPSTDFFTYAQDGLGDQVLKLITRKAQRFSDLPARSYPSFFCEITGTNENAFDNYYVTFAADSQNPYGGTWAETAKPGEQYMLNQHTMPHTLRREADGTFTFGPATWNPRKVGDLESTPMPSFVGRKINDVFFHRNRLGFLSDENICFSQAGEFFNFFPASALQQLDTDPVDVAASHVKVSILRHAIPFNESLLLFSDQTQFMLGKSELLTPATVSVNQTTEFECSLKAKPVGAGKNVYFAVGKGQFTGIREFYVDGDTKLNDAAEVTAHCPRYLPKNVVKLAASSNEDVLVALSSDKPNSLFVYRYYWGGAEKLQSAWSRWEFAEHDQILNCDFIESDLWIVVSRPDGAYIEVLSLEPGRADPGQIFTAHLDRRLNKASAPAVYDAATDTTTITMPFGRLPGEEWELVAWTGNEDPKFRPGRVTKWTPGTDKTLSLRGKLTDFYFGRKYAFRYRFSTLIIREGDAGGKGQQPVGEGRLQLRRMTLTYADTGYFRAIVTPVGREPYTYVFSGRVVGSARNAIGEIAVETGQFPFPVASKNDAVTIELVNDTFLPCAFLSAEWEASFTIRSKRL